jgi:hypothetical protein
MAIIHAADVAGVETGRSVLGEALELGDQTVDVLPLVSHRITSSSVEALHW